MGKIGCRILLILLMSAVLTGCACTPPSQDTNTEADEDIKDFFIKAEGQLIRETSSEKTAKLTMYFPDGKVEDFIFNYTYVNDIHGGGFYTRSYNLPGSNEVVRVYYDSVYYRTPDTDIEQCNVFSGTFTIKDVTQEEK